MFSNTTICCFINDKQNMYYIIITKSNSSRILLMFLQVYKTAIIKLNIVLPVSFRFSYCSEDFQKNLVYYSVIIILSNFHGHTRIVLSILKCQWEICPDSELGKSGKIVYGTLVTVLQSSFGKYLFIRKRTDSIWYYKGFLGINLVC